MTESQDHDARHFIHPDTMIYTKRGPKPIKSITKTDVIINGLGNLLPVAEVLKTSYSGNLYNVDGHLMHEEHEVMIAHPGMKHAHYVSAKELTDKLEMVSVYPATSIDIPNLSVKDCTILGILLSSDISTVRSTDEDMISFKVGMMKDFIVDYATSMDLTPRITDDNYVVMKIPFDDYLIWDVQTQRREKTFYSPLAFLPSEKIAALRSGLWLSNDDEDSNSITLESEKLAESLRLLFYRCHIPVERVLNKIIKLSDDSGRWLNDHTYAKSIVCINTVHYEGLLYDLKINSGNDDECSYLSTFAVNHNGGGKRNGSFAIYLEPWHGDIVDFLELKKPHGEEEKRARDLFYALWIPDLFMERVDKGLTWSLMDPNVSKGLPDVWGQDFVDLYQKYESEGKFVKQMPARTLWNQILVSQIETGTPYLLYKDSVNRKSNQSNLGTIRSSNLCSEICQYTSPEEVSVCNLSSVSLPAFVNREEVCFEFQKMHDVVKVITRNLNKVIDINYYPVEEARTSNMRHRPIGIGIQGLADVFCMLKYPFESQDARKLNRDIAETMYHAALEASCELAAERESDILEFKQLASIENKSKDVRKQYNNMLKRTKFSEEELNRPACPGAYDSYFWNGGCPISKGILQFDMWGVEPSDRYDWAKLKDSIETHGIRNSQLIACMPTASTSQILGNSECLTGDSLVTLANGLSKRIDKFKSTSKSIDVISIIGNKFQTSISTNFFDQGLRDTLSLTLSDGRRITCTPDHKFLSTNSEWVEAKNMLNKKAIIGLTGTEDIVSDDESDFHLQTGQLTFHMKSESERDRTLAFARILGYVMADGTISHDHSVSQAVTATLGCQIDADNFIRDIACIMERPPRVDYAPLGIRVHLHQPLVGAIHDLEGVPHGNRMEQPTSLPTFIKRPDCPKAIVREFLAGHFGGDGHAPSIKKSSNSETGSLSPIKLEHTTRPQFRQEMDRFFLDIINLLRKIGLNGAEKEPDRKVRYTEDNFTNAEFIDNIDMKIRLPYNTDFSRLIGFRYSLQKQLRLMAATSYWRFIADSRDQRRRVSAKAIEIMARRKCPKTTALLAAQEVIFATEKPLSNYSLSNTDAMRYELHSPKKNTGCLPCIEYLQSIQAIDWFKKGYIVGKFENEFPSLQMEVIDIRPGNVCPVYDISVEGSHNFVANGIVVHNCFEPYTSNIYTRRTLAGEFVICNKHLIKDLIEMGLWNDDMKQQILAHEGSVQNIEAIPKPLRDVYKTVWEIKQKAVIDMSADRGAFTCQSQSLNLYVSTPTPKVLTSMHMYGWKSGLCTGIYYLRCQTRAKTQQFTVDPKFAKGPDAAKINSKSDNDTKPAPTAEEVIACSLNNREDCEMCSG